ncbi:RNA ligase family protein [Leptolyngbya sp. AN03gr2]|uniref:RNA ligase family protein n=1 Tax=unclassified Leptolyngbya TaxID=2650499 RepID=UPI003D31EE4A
METIYKYPRTLHIQGSRVQPGDEDLNSIPFTQIANRFVIVEEKVDGANAAISFTADGQLRLQSRGHYLTGGARERHFNLFKQWAAVHADAFWHVLSDRYILYGEWMYAKHTVFYDALPHYFLEYDVLDLAQEQFLSTVQRQHLLTGLPLVSVPILFAGELRSYKQLVGLLEQSHFIRTGHLDRLQQVCEQQELSVDLTLQQTNQSALMEGLYIKVESLDWTIERYKYVRADFLTTILQSESHWLSRPIVPNQLRADVDLFAL